MRTHPSILFVTAALLLLPAPLRATDVDGPNDCQRRTQDYGDAPETDFAYPGVQGAFPTCILPGPIGTWDLACPPLSTAPGPAGFVRNVNPAGKPPYWLGCGTAAAPSGIDSERNGKTNSAGAPVSRCDQNLAVDCFENAFGLVFGQDECYGSDDAGLAGLVTFKPCSPATIQFKASNCATVSQQVFLNILVDWNEDGDWNDNFACTGLPGVNCVYEWAVKNAPITLPPGCTALNSPVFITGPKEGRGWMRITISDQPVPDDFPWNGSAGLAGSTLVGGETEDYPVVVQADQVGCAPYDDFGDAPEGVVAYPSGVVGRFPTCLAPSAPGTREAPCAPVSTPPATTGFVRHVSTASDPLAFWLGCPNPATAFPGVDGERDGKVNMAPAGGTPSACDDAVLTDCAEVMFAGMPYGQDECAGDLDSGVGIPASFTACSQESIRVQLFGCRGAGTVYLNVLVDWNQDGDWNDNLPCPPSGGACAYEWALRNVPLPLQPGCQTIVSPPFLTGPVAGRAWMRVTVSATPVPADYPWAGSASFANGYFFGGETEDYTVAVSDPRPCAEQYIDFGDAPEGFPAYPDGVMGHFPTCREDSPPGTLDLLCGTPAGPPPGPTGFVAHVVDPADPVRFWLGCGIATAPGLGVDSEPDGKTGLQFLTGGKSFCDPNLAVDCMEAAFGMSFGQDECYGTPDAGLADFFTAPTCAFSSLKFLASSCAQEPVEVYLNVLADWNRDGDWNDDLPCPNPTGAAACVPEWAVRNKLVILDPGCGTYESPRFLTGPRPGEGWMRITLSEQPAPPDFPWAGTANMPAQSFFRGETEDYPIRLSAGPVGAEEPVPGGLWFGPLQPNPSRTRTTAHFTLPKQAEVSAAVYDVTGRKLADLLDGNLAAGQHSLSWDFRDSEGRDLPVGIYLVKLRSGGITLTRRVIRIQ